MDMDKIENYMLSGPGPYDKYGPEGEECRAIDGEQYAIECIEQRIIMQLYKHQREAVNFAIENNGCANLFHDPGLGKTLTTLRIFSHYRATNPGLRLLVVCPLSLIRAAWQEDCKRFTEFEFSAHEDIMPGKMPDIIGINFERLIQTKRLQQITTLLKTGDWMLAVDESSRMKNFKSITTKTLLQLAPLAKYRLALSGTPAPNGEWEYWAQARFVAPNILPASYFQFRNQYFHLARGNQVLMTQGRVMTRAMSQQIFMQGWKYAITPEKREILMSKIKTISHIVRKQDALDLPEKIYQIREVRLNPNERRAYNDMRRDLVAEIKEGFSKKAEVHQIVAEVALAKLQKLRQASSGFFYTEEHQAVRAGRSSKLRELRDTIEESVGDKQCIIWINYREEAAAISALLTEDEKTFSTLYAETADKEKSINDFKSGASQFLIANSQSAGHGLTFVNCDTAIYFSLSYSYEQYIQSQDRIHRIGQTNKCLYIHLMATDTIDFLIYEVLTKKKTLQNIIFELLK